VGSTEVGEDRFLDEGNGQLIGALESSELPLVLVRPAWLPLNRSTPTIPSQRR
jgi:hypothetical protein